MAPAAHTTETPSEANLDNTAGITLGVRFTVSETLDIGAVSFYAPTTNTGTYTAGLWETTSDDDPNGSGTGALLETGSLGSGSVTPGAWNDVPLDAPVTCTSGTVYTAGIHTSSGRFVRSQNFYASNSLTGAGVTLLQAGTDPLPPGLGSMVNGVFFEGPSIGYPNSQFNLADYFIDVALAEDEAATAELAITLPALTAGLTAHADTSGAATITLPALTASATAVARAAAAVDVTLPALTADLAVAVPAVAVLDITLPALTAGFTATSAAAAPRSPFAVKRFPGVRANDTLRRTPTHRNVRRRR